jgi:superfamily I DNA/RNA helicase
VLYRVNAQSAAYEAALTDAGVPYLVRGGERFFDRKEVREALLLLRGAVRVADADAPDGLAALTADVLRSGLSWDPSGLPPVRGPRASAGSRSRRSTGSPATSRRRPRVRACASWSPSSRSGRPRSTRRASRA